MNGLEDYPYGRLPTPIATYSSRVTSRRSVHIRRNFALPWTFGGITLRGVFPCSPAAERGT